MTFFVQGLNHRTAPLELRERLTIDKDQLEPSLERLLQFVDRGLVLSTCNRLEVYTFGVGDYLSHQVREFMAGYSGVPGAKLEPHLYRYEEGECVKHLFRVAAGLDSMVVGEKQVLGQVRTAYSVASRMESVPGPLSWLFHQGLRVGRRIHRETGIGSNSRSVSRAAVQLARQIPGDLHQRRTLVIGAGDAGKLVAQALADAGFRNMAVTNRTSQRAVDLARKLGGVAVPFEELSHQLIDADVVISSTGSPGNVLDRTAVQEAMRHRNGRPLLLIDIAVPRDIDPQAGQLDNVRLYDIDALQLVSEADADILEREVARAEAIVAEETERFLEWWESQGVVPLIAAIRERAEEIRRVEVAKTLGKLKGQWPFDTARQLDALTIALVKKLLHHPTVYLREGRDPALQQLARQLFNLDGGEGGRGER